MGSHSIEDPVWGGCTPAFWPYKVGNKGLFISFQPSKVGGRKSQPPTVAIENGH